MLTMHFKILYLQLSAVPQFPGDLQTTLEKTPECLSIMADSRAGDICFLLPQHTLFGNSRDVPLGNFSTLVLSPHGLGGTNLTP